MIAEPAAADIPAMIANVLFDMMVLGKKKEKRFRGVTKPFEGGKISCCCAVSRTCQLTRALLGAFEAAPLSTNRLPGYYIIAKPDRWELVFLTPECIPYRLCTRHR